jgi:DNA-damage-inducible protein J
MRMNYNHDVSSLFHRRLTMPASALVQTRIDPVLKERAAEVLNNMGLTVSDVVRILLTRVANEGALPFNFAVDPAAHDAWFRAKVQEALSDPRPAVSNEDASAHFAKRRAAAMRKAEGKA